MSKHIKTIQDLKDSRILYEKDLPSFGYMIILVLTFMLIILAVWMYKTPKTYIVKGSGIVYSPNKNYIMSSYNGEIREINIKEGAYVEKGTVLLTVASVDLDLQNEQVDGQIAAFKDQIAQYEKLSRCIRDNTNYFDPMSLQDEFYQSKYETYESKRKQLSFDADAYKQYGYTDDQIKQEVIKNESKIEELYFLTIQEINQQIIGINSEIDKLFIQKNAIEKGKSEYQIKAPASGTIHMYSDYKKGMVVQAGNVIGSVSSELDQYMIESYISAGDIPRIVIDQSADIVVFGLIQSDYGVLTGVVKEIDSDVTVNESDGKMYFKVRIAPDMDYLINKSGNKVNLSKGMQVETRIKYDQISYFEYILDALGVRAR